MRNLALLVLVVVVVAFVSLPVAASDVGAKAMFQGVVLNQLEVSPSAGTGAARPRSGPGSPPNLHGGRPGSVQADAASSPIAVRYCLRRVDGNGRSLGETPFGEIFHSGDRVQLTVESNSAGHLAIVQHGSDGHQGLLYPPPTADLGSAPIEARSPIVLPTPRHSFTFDGTPGTERLWLVVARDRHELAALPLRAEMNAGDLAVLRLLVDRESGAKNLVVETLTAPGDPCTYAANVNGRIVVQEIALEHR